MTPGGTGRQNIDGKALGIPYLQKNRNGISYCLMLGKQRKSEKGTDTGTDHEGIVFDIDGTLVNKRDSCRIRRERKALDQARARDTNCFCVPGEIRVQIYSFLKDYGFDSVVSAAGAMVSCEERRFYFIGEEPLNRCNRLLCGPARHLQTAAASGSYMDKKSYQVFEDVAEKYHLDERVLKAVTNGMEMWIRSGDIGMWKMFYFKMSRVGKVQQALGRNFWCWRAACRFRAASAARARLPSGA